MFIWISWWIWGEVLQRESAKDKPELSKKRRIRWIATNTNQEDGKLVGLAEERPRVSLKITYCSVSGLLNNSTALHAPAHVSFTSIFYLSLYSVINSVFGINSLITEFLVVKRYCNIIYWHQYFLMLSSFLFVVTT